MKFPVPFWFLPGELPGYLIIGHEVAIRSEYGTTRISTPQTETERDRPATVGTLDGGPCEL